MEPRPCDFNMKEANSPMKKTLSGLLAILTLTSLSGCLLDRTLVNEPLSPESIQQLSPGKTTAKEVVDLLGAPNDVVQLGKRTAYRYDSSVAKQAGLTLLVITFFNEDTRTDRLWVFFDEGEVLSHYGSTLSSHRPQYALPWEDVHSASDQTESDANRPGL